MYKDKIDEVVELLKNEFEAGSFDMEEIHEIIEMVIDDVFKDFPTYHLGTFAEFKNTDEFRKTLFPNKTISESVCAWATADIQEAIRRTKEGENV